MLTLPVYVGFNLLIIGCVPFVHDLTVKVHVGERAEFGTAALGSVSVGWVEVNPTSGVEWVQSVGDTNKDGNIVIPVRIQEQPLWAWPRIGSYKLRGRTLRFHKVGYLDRDIGLIREFPDLSYQIKEVELAVFLTASE
jgi:hypothetical protein